MEMPKNHAADAQVEQVELAVSKLLRIGTFLAAVQISAGLALLLLIVGSSLGTILLTTGLITLVATPMLRVIAALVIYLKLGDRTYALISLIVVLVVLTGVLLGQTH